MYIYIYTYIPIYFALLLRSLRRLVYLTCRCGIPFSTRACSGSISLSLYIYIQIDRYIHTYTYIYVYTYIPIYFALLLRSSRRSTWLTCRCGIQSATRASSGSKYTHTYIYIYIYIYISHPFLYPARGTRCTRRVVAGPSL